MSNNSTTSKELLKIYLDKFVIIQEQQKQYFLYLSKPNIKLISLFILSTMRLDESLKHILYQIIMKTSNIDNEQLKMFFEILSSIINIYPILYDYRNLSMLDFIYSNYINILCDYKGVESSPLILFNARKILGDMFDNNSNVIDLFRNDTRLFDNVFTSDDDMVKYVNNKLYPSVSNNRYRRSNRRSRRSRTRRRNRSNRTRRRSNSYR